jgi:hypothetical protein
MKSMEASFQATVRAGCCAAGRAVHQAHRLTQLARRKAQLPKACFLGITAVASVLFGLLASLSQF